MEVKYGHKDFNKLLTAFINIQAKGCPENLTSEDIDPLLEYPEAVINEFLKAVGAIGSDIVTSMSTDTSMCAAVEMYVLLRMNLVKVPNPHDNPDI